MPVAQQKNRYQHTPRQLDWIQIVPAARRESRDATTNNGPAETELRNKIKTIFTPCILQDHVLTIHTHNSSTTIVIINTNVQTCKMETDRRGQVGFSGGKQIDSSGKAIRESIASRFFFFLFLETDENGAKFYI